MRWQTSTGIFLAMLMALIGTALWMMGRECSGYVCVAHGIAWVLWLAFYLPTLALGYLCRPRLPAGSRLARPLRIGQIISWLLPPVIIVFWLYVLIASFL